MGGTVVLEGGREGGRQGGWVGGREGGRSPTLDTFVLQMTCFNVERVYQLYLISKSCNMACYMVNP